MFQVYLLTVVTNVLAGLALANGFLQQRFDRFADYTGFMANKVYRVVLGAITFLIGIITLFQAYPNQGVIIGDLLPALSGLITGFLLVAEFVAKRGDSDAASDPAAGLAKKVESFSGPYVAIVGLAAVVLGVLHALVGPSAVLL